MENPPRYRDSLRERSPSLGFSPSPSRSHNSSDADDEGTPPPVRRKIEFSPRVRGGGSRNKFPAKSNEWRTDERMAAARAGARGDEKGHEEPAAVDVASTFSDRLTGTDPKDYEKMLRVCRDVREARKRGTSANVDVRKACQWLLDREDVPANLQAVAWAQLLRGDMQESGSDGEGERVAGPEMESVGVGGGKRFCRAVDSGDDNEMDVEDVEEEARGRKRTVDEEDEERRRRETESQELDSPRFCAEDEGRQLSISPIAEDTVQVGGAKEPNRLSPWLAKYGKQNVRNEEEKAEKETKLQRENAMIDDRLNDLLARQKAKTDESLQALEQLVLGRCTCKAKCHCIYGSTVHRASSSADGITARQRVAGLPPTNNEIQGLPRDMFREARLDLEWFDKKHATQGKMPEGKMDSIRPEGLPRSPNS